MWLLRCAGRWRRDEALAGSSARQASILCGPVQGLPLRPGSPETEAERAGGDRCDGCRRSPLRAGPLS